MNRWRLIWMLLTGKATASRPQGTGRWYEGGLPAMQITVGWKGRRGEDDHA